ncbi:hypothetical protein RM549_09755 [Salegentibacter sp. F188]|uniref:Uncharacterized protein n=1 Tax=Autumnicola patrickiae TaxID=3075591 RepID=A0ABU3E243_9FLAO|nr:hypothetical protein [Salegentibacter sp. F188]MDT0690068.1 hypothetical protein [Salegentibacter sp. F188]
METSPESFYSSYIKEYHEVKANYLFTLLNDIEKTNENLKCKELIKEDVSLSLTNNTKFILQTDLRQNYFHCIETFFEFFFAFLPNNEIVPDNSKIVRQLVKANWQKNYKRIEQIANGKMKLNFLDQEIEDIEHNVTIGHYLFYPGTYAKGKFDNNWYQMVSESIENIKNVIKILASDFCPRDEYNAYKHTMRAYPNYQSLHLLDLETKEEKLSFDISNSISFQIYNDKEKETIVNTKMLDPQRDFDMTKQCSRLIHNMVELRNVMFNRNQKNGNNKVAILLFGEDNVAESSKHNVDIQDLSFSTKIV